MIKSEDFICQKRGKREKLAFTPDDVINKFGESPVCYITGKKIDIYNTKSYHFDHKLPRSKGGLNTLDNLGICTKQANMAKNDMTEDELIQFCKDVLIYRGFKIN